MWNMMKEGCVARKHHKLNKMETSVSADHDLTRIVYPEWKQHHMCMFTMCIFFIKKTNMKLWVYSICGDLQAETYICTILYVYSGTQYSKMVCLNKCLEILQS